MVPVPTSAQQQLVESPVPDVQPRPQKNPGTGPPSDLHTFKDRHGDAV